MRYDPIVSRESAQYPFTTRASDEVAKMGLDFGDLADPMYVRVLNRAQGRVNEAIVYGRVESKIADAPSELLSYALAGAFVVSIGDLYLTRRYAVAEAKRVHDILREEPNRRVVADLVRDELGWDVKLVIPTVEEELEDDIKMVYCFDLYFAYYLSASTSFKETEWKMGNKVVRDGYVLLTQKQLARLVENMVEKETIERLSRPVKIKLPEAMLVRVGEIRVLLDKNRPKVTPDQIPSQMVRGAFPPCISYYLEGVTAGRKAGHIERFALVSFLANVQMGDEDIIKLFSVSDFSESLTRYQVEHISGTRRGGKPYTPPTCKTLQSHGICRAQSDGRRICGNIAHPLQYYRICTRDR
jgi:DNA primase large subunit